MKRVPLAILSLLLGWIAAIAVPAVLIWLGQPDLGTSIWGTMFSRYLGVAGWLEPIVWKALPWPHLVPGGGGSGAFALMLVCTLVSWGLLFAVLWYLGLRAWTQRK
jgi:hypothetical protein